MTDSIPSLIKYLDSSLSGIFRLKFSDTLKGEELAGNQSCHYPFVVISDKGPFNRILEGSFITDAGAEIKKVFLVLQKNDYVYRHNDLLPLTNTDIEEYWQRLYRSHQSPDAYLSVILGDQQQTNNIIKPFRSLFYCRQRRRFFHPPCPKCGYMLEQCYDDEYLIQYGLKPYSRSLERYLFCPKCRDLSIPPEFYAYAKKDHHPLIVKERDALIRQFSELKGKHIIPDAMFPCLNCTEFDLCYRRQSQTAIERIIPLSFYHFHLMIIEADLICGTDYLALLSGASAKEISHHHTNQDHFSRTLPLNLNSTDSNFFLFKNEPKLFLEILYLKLSFLGELASYVLAELGERKYPDYGLSADCLWVKWQPLGQYLPSGWNFSVKFIAIGGENVGTDQLPAFPPAYGLSFLGHIWFIALLTNRKQSVKSVLGAMAELLHQPHKNLNQTEALTDNCPIFSPPNIYWNPESVFIEPLYYPLWVKTLELGWDLIKAAMDLKYQFSCESFFKRYSALKLEIKQSLFQSLPVVSSDKPTAEPQAKPAPEPQTNTAIRQILTSIYQKWQQGEPSPSLLGKTEQPVPVIEPGQTTIESAYVSKLIDSKTIQTNINHLEVEANPVSQPDNDWDAETVIISAGNKIKSTAEHRIKPQNVQQLDKAKPSILMAEHRIEPPTVPQPDEPKSDVIPLEAAPDHGSDDWNMITRAISTNGKPEAHSPAISRTPANIQPQTVSEWDMTTKEIGVKSNTESNTGDHAKKEQLKDQSSEPDDFLTTTLILRRDDIFKKK